MREVEDGDECVDESYLKDGNECGDDGEGGVCAMGVAIKIREEDGGGAVGTVSCTVEWRWGWR